MTIKSVEARLALSLVLALASGCLVPDVNLDGKACSSGQPCSDGYQCLDGQCLLPGESPRGGVDAGPVDAGPVDAGPVDAGPVDAGEVIFTDGFAASSDGGIPHPWTVGAGTWAISGSAASGTGTGLSFDSIWAPIMPSDYTVQARVQFPDSPAIYCGGVGARRSAMGAHYAAWYYPNGTDNAIWDGGAGPHVVLIKFTDSVTPVELWSAPLSTGAGTVGLVGLRVSDNHLDAEFNGQPVIDFFDDGGFAGAPLTSGGVVLDTFMFTVPYASVFSDVVVSVP